jgi:hypothetical protein
VAMGDEYIQINPAMVLSSCPWCTVRFVTSAGAAKISSQPNHPAQAMASIGAADCVPGHCIPLGNCQELVEDDVHYDGDKSGSTHSIRELADTCLSWTYLSRCSTSRLHARRGRDGPACRVTKGPPLRNCRVRGWTWWLRGQMPIAFVRRLVQLVCRSGVVRPNSARLVECGVANQSFARVLNRQSTRSIGSRTSKATIAHEPSQGDGRIASERLQNRMCLSWAHALQDGVYRSSLTR